MTLWGAASLTPYRDLLYTPTDNRGTALVTYALATSGKVLDVECFRVQGMACLVKLGRPREHSGAGRLTQDGWLPQRARLWHPRVEVVMRQKAKGQKSKLKYQAYSDQYKLAYVCTFH